MRFEAYREHYKHQKERGKNQNYNFVLLPEVGMSAHGNMRGYFNHQLVALVFPHHLTEKINCEDKSDYCRHRR